MTCLLLRKGVALLFQAIEVLLCVCYILSRAVHSQGYFPRLQNIAAYKSVSIVPSQATCGLPVRNTFCLSTTTPESTLSCTQQFCIQECPFRSSSPSYADLFSRGLRTCVTEDKHDLRPGSSRNSTSFIFWNEKDCYTGPSLQNLGFGSSFTLTLWLKPDLKDVMTIIEKAINGQTIFKLTISETGSMFYYRTSFGLEPPAIVNTRGKIHSNKWTHLAIQTQNIRVSFFINGLEEDNTAFDTQLLTEQISDATANAVIRIGQSLNGSEQFIGRMQDLRFYQTALTNREIHEVFSGKLPFIHTQPNCRCPGTHPRVHPLVQRYCIPNGADDTTNDRVLRLNLHGHPLNYINDEDIGTSWVSSVFTDLAQLDNGVSITVDLQNGQYEVFYIILQFSSPQPEVVKIQRKRTSDSEWLDWQYFARDCPSMCGMANNAPLEHPDTVNCLQFPRTVPYSGGNVTFSILTSEPNRRPGYNDFYNTPALQKFVKTTHVRIHLRGQYHTRRTSVNFRHRYYGVNEITISGRCNCHGHADHCDTTANPYKCMCMQESHTEGDNCERCQPLFNDKPFHQGDQIHAYNCKPCQCYEHAISCHYDTSIDPFPHDYFQGGGGICDGCQHNTAGQNCEWCKDYFYREIGISLSATEVCKPCDCLQLGVINGSLLCDQIGGQCKCKRRVSGRQCNQCQDGFYNLCFSDPDGCSPCNCNTSGTVNGDITCHQNSGQCKCKANVIGISCEHCNFGFKLLNSPNSDGCESCNCNVNGSEDQFCNPYSGHCNCKANIKGFQCDTCMDNFYGLNAGGCKPCECDSAGSLVETICDSKTGQCVCQPNVGGQWCDFCLDGYYDLRSSNSLACLPCTCDTAGTINSSMDCDKSTGQCLCKTHVTGLHCDQCIPHTFNISSSNPEGCQWCNCDPEGTVEGTVCDPNNGQCICQPNRHEKQCDQCRPGFMLPLVNSSGCLPCECHPIGSIHQICDGVTGQCVCRDPSVTGRRCDHCKEHYFDFNPGSGSCHPCNCNPAGSVNATCHQTNGACFCKQFVTGLKCDVCAHNMSHLDVNNTFGCSNTPIQQPPPTAHILNSTAVNLSWSPPDAPNTNELTYMLYRDGVEIHTVQDKYPFGLKSFCDTGLTPYTTYSYYILASNVHGSTRSSVVSYRTKTGQPTGLLHLSHVGFVGSRSVLLNWTTPSNASGPIERYILKSTTPGNPVAQAHYKGLQTFVTLNDLTPFTKYTFIVQACTTGGCIESNPVVEITEQAPPERQGLPIIRTVSSTELFIEWIAPAEPNGIIMRYELYMRRLLQTDGSHNPPQRCILQNSGRFNPQSSLESPNETALIPPQTHTTVTNLLPFTVYEFQVHAINIAGSAPSQWATGRTAEGVPLFMAAPSVFSLSSSALNVTWVEPSSNSIRGEVIGYIINIDDEQTTNQFVLPITSRVLHKVTATKRFYIVTDLKPYTIYNFTITVCNRIGCITSERGAGQTLAAAPAGQSAPRVEAVNSTMMKLYWQPPMDMNGPPPVYQLERMDTSLFSHLVHAEKGTRFPGHGYFKFPSSTLPVNTFFTGIKLSFKTSQPDGLILFAVSVGNQEEYVVLQIQNGHPFFLFDPQGSAVAVTPTNDRGQTYNDNQWHHITATRTQAEGTIVVDGQYTGSAFATSGSTIIGDNTGVFIGGLPPTFTIIREDTGDTKVIEKGFVGCLSDVQIKKRVTPTEDWEPLDWHSAEEKVGTYHSWEGCPRVLVGGAHFLGQESQKLKSPSPFRIKVPASNLRRGYSNAGYLELHSSTFSGGMQFEVLFQLKTDKLSGFLFFAYNKEMKTYLAAELHSGTLSFLVKTSSSITRVDLWLGLSYCDGKWKNITLKKQGAVASVNVNGQIKEELATEEEELQINSPIYLGGIPTEAESFCRGCELKQGFGGCIKDVRFTKGDLVNLVTASTNAVRVHLDGCLSPAGTGNCKENNSIVVFSGRKRIVYDDGLHPFTEYLYRIIASNQGGSAFSPWERGRTKEAVPQNVPTPSRIRSINGYRVEVSWDEPAEVRGVIEKYILKAYNEDSPSTPLIRANFTDTRSLAGNLTGLIPFTNYSITLTVCTMAGCAESADTWKLTTPEEAPKDVQAPTAVSFPTSLLVSWPLPKQTNGIITLYTMFKDGKPVYTGNEQTYNVTGLAVYSAYQFVLEACTVIGCANSSQVTLFTAQLPPSYVDAPALTVLDLRSIYVQWREPPKINGHLERYLLHVLTSNLSNSDVMYNSSDLSVDCTLRQLEPGTRYFIKLSACTGGGCTMSPASTAKTEENTPEKIPAPVVHSYTSNSFNISWAEPELPNGIVINYGLFMNGLLVENTSSPGCHVNDLTAWSLHNFRVQACTAKGCALGPLVKARTLGSAPLGSVSLAVIVEDPRSVQVKWTAPSAPNGLLTYSIIFTGLFYAEQGKNNYSIRRLTQRLHERSEADTWVTIRGLLPYSNYTMQVNASNSHGYVISDLAAIKMPPGAPDGVLPPRLSSATPTSLQVAWSAPARNNAPGLPSYQLQTRLLHSTGDISELLPNKTAAFSYLATDLHPYTAYEFRLIASNGHGHTMSDWTQMVTSEDKPGPVDPPLVLKIRPQGVLLTWQHPSQSNGNITHYQIYLNGTRLVTLSNNITRYSIAHLHPYTMYVFQVESCTSAGCSLSPESRVVQTLPKAPENISNPELYSDTPTSVLISWNPPAHPNGVMDNVVIQRKVKGTEDIFTLVTETSDQPLRYVDNSADLNPWTTYEYRILVRIINGGTKSSAWKEITTRPSRPAGVQAPHIQILSPNSVKVTWRAPLMMNGEILHYEIRMPSPHITILNTSVLQYTVMDLVPFTNYSVTIVACTSGGGFTGGCTESLPSGVITHPTVSQGISPLVAMPISESFISVSWRPPTRPNGPNVRYELLRHKSKQPLASNPPKDLNLWLNIYSGTQMYYEDKGLNRYTTYKYKLVVYNDVGYAPGGEVTATTLAGVPNSGSNLTAQAINHRAIEVEWTRPTLQELEGDVEYYILYINSTAYSNSVSFPADVNYTQVDDLHSNTEYWLFIEVFNGAHSARSEMVHVTTSGGEPEGMLPPEVNVINSTAVRVIWTSPSKPNGLVTEYSLYVNKEQRNTGMNLPGSFVMRDLLPFTVYEVQVEVCIVYACTKSNSTQVTTLGDKPDDIAAPHIHVINSRSLRIDWKSPRLPNGIIRGYEIWRRTLHLCADVIDSKENQKSQQCVYVQCKGNENICGRSCYQAESQVCCDGLLYSSQPDYACCEDRYIASSLNSSDACCGGLLHTFQPGFQCCGNYYVRIQPGEVCCPNVQQNQVSIGIGDSCCSGNPYFERGDQICCGNLLHDGFNQQCCGKQLVRTDLLCCGNEEEGIAYEPIKGLVCCGQDLINASITLCCIGPDGSRKSHIIDGAQVKCCGTEVISSNEQFCNGVGYIPSEQSCVERNKDGKRDCGTSAECSLSQRAGGYCNGCDFNISAHICTWSEQVDVPTSVNKELSEKLCFLPEEIISTVGPRSYTFTDTNLDPYVTYEYRVVAWNRYGWGFSNISRATTEQEMPQGVNPPQWRKVDNRTDMILLSWKAPSQPNGIIIHYIVLRDGTEHFRGTDFSFTDAGGIQPYQEYTYQLRACTIARCADSSKVIAATVQGVPENVYSPTVIALNATSLLLLWRTPTKPNGIIHEYQVHQIETRLIYTDTTNRMKFIVADLQPHTTYTFTVTACTSVGCSTSQPATGRTLQSSPEGVWSKPHHVVVSSNIVELYWTEPMKPNGIITHYHLLRDDVAIFTGASINLNYTDTGLQPNTRYVYQLQANTRGGSGRSENYIVQTPESTPERIPAPYNVTVASPYSLFIGWTPPGVFNTTAPLLYNVTLNLGTAQSTIHPAGHYHFLLVEELNPFTDYEIRVQACQPDGCGVGKRAFVKTAEAPPQNQQPPVITAVGSAVVEVKWLPPEKRNGIITNYSIYRRPVGTQEELLIFIWSEGALEFIDASDMLQPYTGYEYRVRAHNSRGSVDSMWAFVQTLEAAPQGMVAPSIQATSAFSVLLHWILPRSPNGVISQYRVVYQERRNDPTINATTVTAVTMPGTSNQAHVFGLKPFTIYNFQVLAINNIGQVSSPWTPVRTLEASPSGLSNITVEHRENGRALLLKWSEPTNANGIIKTYNIYVDGNLEYSGLFRQFLFRRLEPYTVYTLVLEACTKAGCTHLPPQEIRTDEAQPTSQPAPAIQSVNATQIELRWIKPLSANGKIMQFDVFRKSNRQTASYGEERELLIEEEVVFREYETGKDDYVFIHSNLIPWTRYEYKVRCWNSVGHADSPWVVVKTSQDAPTGLSAPEVQHVSDNPHKLIISWSAPEKNNGVLQSYRLQRNELIFRFNFDALTFNYTDEGLLAYTVYSYAVIACTVGGCCTSEATKVRTLETAPASVNPPILQTISATQINATWMVSIIQTGKISEYRLLVNNEQIYSGLGLTTVVSGLKPYTRYSFILIVCTNGGCTSSSSVNSQTMEAPPSNMVQPKLQVTGSESIEVTWKEPNDPNGLIRNYELRRDGVLIYTGLETRYHDFTLTPGVDYSYIVAAYNSQRSTISPPSKARTNPSAPSGMAPPQLRSWTSHDIMVNWQPPAQTNGVIVNYTIFCRDLTTTDVKAFTFSPPDTSFMSQSLKLTGQKPYSRYEVRSEACTILGCASSEWASVRTLEAPPTMQPRPVIELQTDVKGIQSVFLISWTMPKMPNGQILYYELYRRRVTHPSMNTELALVYNGSSTLFQDKTLLPYTEYEYQVSSVNFEGKTSSAWTRSRTGQAPPEDLYPPRFVLVHSTSATVNITPPTQPNGIISLYRLFARNWTRNEDLLLSEGTLTQQTIHGLEPFSNYSIGVEACTCYKCCSKGPVARLVTHSSAPANQPPPLAENVKSMSANLQWNSPQSPNGIIQSYELQMLTPCPQPMQPIAQSCIAEHIKVVYTGKGQSFNLTDLQPYTSYNLKIISYNSVGSTASEWITITTPKEMPQYKAPFSVTSNLTTIYVDWSQTFQLNGELKEYVLTENNMRIYSGFDNRLHIPRTSDKTFLFQVTCVTDMGSANTPIIKYSTTTDVGSIIPIVEEKTGILQSNTQFYNELWFIIIMAILGLLFVAIFLAILLQKAINKQPHKRERPPLIPLQKRTNLPNESFMKNSNADNASNLYSNVTTLHVPLVSTPQVEQGPIERGLSDTKITGHQSHVSNSNISVLCVPSQSQLSHAYSQTSLHRSISQLIDIHDRKSLIEDSVWDSLGQGRDSGMYPDDEDLLESIKGFSSVTKEHTIFTDTQL
ncbi:usherin isoform X2 [Scyliorhinus canicula]|uniref:usherin isoform X2 n=1 Tax=Scyliorhinus canicula TaxID=7830 RepID=UPI0018F7CA86|nr:usherin isoform X2 [Scyliorhinus canicula]